MSWMKNLLWLEREETEKRNEQRKQGFIPPKPLSPEEIEAELDALFVKAVDRVCIKAYDAFARLVVASPGLAAYTSTQKLPKVEVYFPGSRKRVYLSRDTTEPDFLIAVKAKMMEYGIPVSMSATDKTISLTLQMKEYKEVQDGQDK